MSTAPGPCDGCLAIYYAADDHCYRIPTILQTSQGTLLAFAEKRIASCSDDGPIELVVRRSTDLGTSWGPVITVRRGESPCDGCPGAISNPNPVEVAWPDGAKAILLHYDTLNNPQPDRHGLDMQAWSHDDGLSWTNGTVLSYPPQENMGAMVGPSVGLQSPRTGRLYFSAHLAFSYVRRMSALKPQA